MGKKKDERAFFLSRSESISLVLLALLTGDPLPLSASVSEASKRLVGAETAARKSLVPRADPAIFHRAERVKNRTRGRRCIVLAEAVRTCSACFRQRSGRIDRRFRRSRV